ncbi:MAG: peptide transporter substrate-binding protein [Cryobacterium sp.]|jgi:peptide/nickel transport system substrate-binding protein|nr:peptide transporter substrate-binding protein [Cryobacterium sp.]
MLRWRTATAALAITAALALTSCSGGATGSGDEGAGGTLTLGAITAPTTYDAGGSEWGNRAPFYQAVYDTLLLATSKGEIEPFLAESWEYDDTNTVLTLKIRDDVTFTDDSKLTADVVKQNLERFKTGTSPDAGYLTAVSSVEAPDETTVVITLAAPDPAMLNYLTRSAGLIASGEALADAESLATTPVGSGPYMLDADASVSGTSYTYTKNPDYWNPDLQHYDTLKINVLGDATAALNAIKAGEVNGIKLQNNDNLAEVEGAGWTVNANELDFQGLLLLDRAGTTSEPLGDVRVRQAINHAVDRKAMLTALQSDNGTVTAQVFPESSPAYDPELDKRYPFDPKKAKDLLADAGYADGFTLAMPSSPLLGTSVYTLLSQQLKDVGITAEYTDPGNNFIADLLAPKFPAAFMSLEQSPDWQLIQFMISPTAIFNPYHYADPEVDRMIAEIQNGDEATQADVAKELNQYVVEQAWFAPWYRVQNSFPTDANTTVEMMPTNVYPAIYDFKPKA